MPVILDADTWGRWLDLGSEVDDLKALLAPAPRGTLVACAVSSRLNSPKHDDPQCIEAEEF